MIRFLLILALVLCVLAIGLKIADKMNWRFHSSSTPASSSPATGGGATATADASSDPQATFNAAVTAFNGISNIADECFQSYSTAFDLDTGPTSHDQAPPNLELNIEIVQPDVDSLKQALDADPGTTPLDVAARQFAVTTQALIDAWKPANDYYSKEDFKDDQFARGREMNASIVAAFRAYNRASSDLRTIIENTENQQRVKELADLKASGPPLQYNLLLNLTEARETLKFVESEVARTGDVRKINVDTLTADNDKMEDTVGALQKLKDAGMEVAGTDYLDSFIGDSNDFLKECRYLQRSVRDNQEMQQEYFTMGDGSEADIVSRYNTLVNAYNNFTH